MHVVHQCVIFVLVLASSAFFMNNKAVANADASFCVVMENKPSVDAQLTG